MDAIENGIFYSFEIFDRALETLLSRFYNFDEFRVS
jgi:hypothetical protein